MAQKQEIKSAYSSHIYLVKMLNEGWQIEPPVYVRQHWLSRLEARKRSTYHFVLRQGNISGLVSVLDCPEIQQFLDDEKLAVDRL